MKIVSIILVLLAVQIGWLGTGMIYLARCRPFLIPDLLTVMDDTMRLTQEGKSETEEFKDNLKEISAMIGIVVLCAGPILLLAIPVAIWRSSR